MASHPILTVVGSEGSRIPANAKEQSLSPPNGIVIDIGIGIELVGSALGTRS
jgi:hypothetical protein